MTEVTSQRIGGRTRASRSAASRGQGVTDPAQAALTDPAQAAPTDPAQVARADPAQVAGPAPGQLPVQASGQISAGAADLTRIRYGAWLIAAAFGLLGTVFGVAVWRYPSASDVAAVIGTLATVTGTILGAFFGAQVGSAGKDAAEAGRRSAERTAQMALGKLDPAVAEDLVRKL